MAAERHGVWGRAIEVPGLAALNTGEYAVVNSVSCTSAGSCAAGGNYFDHSGTQGFVAAERHGVWGKAVEVPGLGALNATGIGDGVGSVSCASVGNCAAVGGYSDSHDDTQGFVAVERTGLGPGDRGARTGGPEHGRGRRGQLGVVRLGRQLRGRRVLRLPPGRPLTRGFVAVERDGAWRKAIEVPGLGALDTDGSAVVKSVSCPSAGNCAAARAYNDSPDSTQGFVASERHGRWRKAIEVLGLAALNTLGGAGVGSVSCGSAGSCAAGGSYWDRHGAQGFVAVETNGVWGTATEVPGLAALNNGPDPTDEFANVYSASCAPAGGCAAAGTYADRGGNRQGFVADERG